MFEDVEILVDEKPQPARRTGPALRFMALLALPILLLGLGGALLLTLGALPLALLFSRCRSFIIKLWGASRLASALSLAAFVAVFSPLFGTTILLAYFSSRSDHPGPLAAILRSVLRK